VHDSSVRLPSDSLACYVNEATRSHHVENKSGVQAWTEMQPWLGSGPVKDKKFEEVSSKNLEFRQMQLTLLCYPEKAGYLGRVDISAKPVAQGPSVMLNSLVCQNHSWPRMFGRLITKETTIKF
jgi:hypothetical protein